MGDDSSDLTAFRAEVDERFDKIDQRFDRLEGKFDANAEGIQRNTEGIQRNTEAIRHAHVLIERNGHRIDLLAEGLQATNERIDRLEQRMDQRFDDLEGLIRQVVGHITEFRDDHERRITLEQRVAS